MNTLFDNKSFKKYVQLKLNEFIPLQTILFQNLTIFKNLIKTNFKNIFNFTIFTYNNFSLRHINICYMYGILLFCLFSCIFHSYCSIILYFIYWWQHLRPSSNYTNNRQEDILYSSPDFYFFFLIFLTFLWKNILI